MRVDFFRHLDPEREGVHYYSANLGDGRSALVQEVSAAVVGVSPAVWGWLIVNESDGGPLEMRNGFANHRSAIFHLGTHLGEVVTVDGGAVGDS